MSDYGDLPKGLNSPIEDEFKISEDKGMSKYSEVLKVMREHTDSGSQLSLDDWCRDKDKPVDTLFEKFSHWWIAYPHDRNIKEIFEGFMSVFQPEFTRGLQELSLKLSKKQKELIPDRHHIEEISILESVKLEIESILARIEGESE